jgi:beta-lactam-binding protein with PASTA domain
MPTLTGGNTNGASSKVKKAGLKLRRIDVSKEGALPGTVLAQSPGPGAKVPTGSEVIIEATPGNPPPTVPLPDTTGSVAAEAVASMKKTGWTVTEVLQPAPVGVLLPTGLPPAPGQIWQMSPAVGTVTRDGKVTVYVQP